MLKLAPMGLPPSTPVGLVGLPLDEPRFLGGCTGACRCRQAQWAGITPESAFLGLTWPFNPLSYSR